MVKTPTLEGVNGYTREGMLRTQKQRARRVCYSASPSKQLQSGFPEMERLNGHPWQKCVGTGWLRLGGPRRMPRSAGARSAPLGGEFAAQRGSRAGRNGTKSRVSQEQNQILRYLGGYLSAGGLAN